LLNTLVFIDMKHTIIDLFAGAGGLSTGFHMAGFESLCAIDINSKALDTYSHNYPQARIINQDIQKINPSELRLLLGLKREELTALIGDPPCQGFSRNVTAGYRYLNDPRNLLYKTFLEYVKEFRPLYVLMENVPEILKAYGGVVRNDIHKELEFIGYKVISASLNAANYGVPQTRSRAFFIASLDNKAPSVPEPTHKDLKNDFQQQLSIFESFLTPIITVRDAIGDLPSLEAGEEYVNEYYPSSAQSDYQSLLRSKSKKITNHVARALSPIQMARANALKEGEDARNLPPELAPKKHYSGAYGRLFWDKPAKTITKWVFHPGSGRFFHPNQNRTITIREAARLHSYPDNFHFLGSYTNMAAQIGESVPPILAKAIAVSLLKQNYLHQKIVAIIAFLNLSVSSFVSTQSFLYCF
ncbi:MAG: DNA cytosine methyltransferase, partial [Cyanobacteria bacterium J06629_18]